MIAAARHLLIFLSMNIAVALTAWWTLRSLFSLTRVTDWVLAAFLLYLTEIFSVTFFWGSVDRMTPAPILGTLFVLFGAAFFSGRRRLSKGPSLSKAFREMGTFLCGNRFLLFSVSALSGFLAIKVIYNLRYPPLGWDSIGYHLVFPVEWMKKGKIWFHPIIFGDPSPSYYPFMGGLYYFWLLLPFRSAFMADAGQFPFYVGLLIATYGFSRRLGLDREVSVYAAILLGLIPNVMKHVEVSYVDLMVAAYFMIALYFASLFYVEKNFSDLFFASLAAAFLVGTKSNGLLWFALLVPYLFAGACKAFWKRKKDFVLFGFCATAILFLYGAPSYVRNLILTGDLTYPLSFKMGPFVSRGVIPLEGYRYHPGGEFRWSEFYFHNGLGAQLLILITPGLFITLFLELRKKKIDWERLYWIFLPLLSFWVWVFVVPIPGNVRYIYHAFAVGCVVSLSAYDRLPRKILRLFVLLCVLASAAELAGHWELIFSLFGMVMLMALGELKRGKKFSVAFSPRLWVAAASVLVIFLGALEVLYRKNEFDLYPHSQFSNYDERLAQAWKWVNVHTPPKGARVAYTGTCLPYPLYGTDLKNDVFYATVNGQPASLHLCGGDYRRGARYDRWEKVLLEGGVDLVVVYDIVRKADLPPFVRRPNAVDENTIGVFPIEDAWAREHPERLSLVFQNERVHIYSVKKES